ncbi:MAG: hypothetical protein CBC29_08105 [Methylococcaceae bacterium TMED69]|nr:MAG: hypothetical protein CBC29_08105 [Methylococcaceae bacterium TMED69]|tara:strand:+ start:888 stop:2147 length:1260 start_codon:yes stop_codon:yes gene_type:complete
MKMGEDFLDRWVKAINSDDGCALNGRGFSEPITFEIGSVRNTLTIVNGKIDNITVDSGPLVRSVLTLSASEDVWSKLLDPKPPALYNDFFALIAIGDMKFDGDIKIVFQQWFTFSNWVRVGRELQGPLVTASDPEFFDEWQAVGRYTNVTIDGARHKVFYFEAGEGIPLICQHTAGNENRQWRHLLEDRELTKKFRVIAYDLPSHGKSDPSCDKDLYSEDQLLRSEWVTKFVMSFIDSLGIKEKPVFIGCSIGAVIGLHLAAKYADKFRGIISLAGTTPTYGFFHDWWIDPDINTQMNMPGLMDSVMAPDISKVDRQINRTIQSSSPRVIRNDLHLWGVDNGDEHIAKSIDGTKLPVFVYAGEYDFTCPPDHVEESVKKIKGANYKTLKGLGHFPMSECYERFRPTLLETLEEIVSSKS